MKPKFKVSTRYTIEEYINLNRFYIRKAVRVPSIIFLVLVFCTVFAISRVGMYGAFEVKSLVLPALCADASYFVFYAVISIGVEMSAKKHFESNKKLKNALVEFTFFEDCFSVESPEGSSIINYEDIYRVYETEENFYIMTGKSQGYIIVRAECEQALIDFLHKMTRKNGR